MLRGRDGTRRNLGAWHLAVRGDYGGSNDNLKFLRWTGSGTTLAGIAMALSNAEDTLMVGPDTSCTDLNVLAGTPKIQIGSGTGHASLQFYSGTTSVNGIYFGDTSNANADRYKGYIEYRHNDDSMALQAAGENKINITADVTSFTDPIQTTTDTGTRMYTGLATGSHYGNSGYLILDTNIPAHDVSGNANMFSISIEGFMYNSTDGGIVDLNIGCYSGEGNYYNAAYSGSNIPDGWVTNMWVAKNPSGKVAFIFGTTGLNQAIEVACTKFIQGYVNVNAAYANGWDFQVNTSLTGYSQLTVVRPKFTKKPSFSASSNGFSVTTGWQNISDSMTEVTDGPTNNYNPTNGRFTPQFPGWYQFNCGGWSSYSDSTGALRWATCFAKNGSLQYIQGGNYSTADTPLAGGSQRIYLNGTSDYVELWAYSSVAATWGGSSHHVWWDGYWTGS
jgi:hypothetical protein